MGKITFELDVEDDEHKIELYLNSQKMYNALHEIYNLCRSEIKHGDEELSDHIDDLLERIKEESYFVTEM